MRPSREALPLLARIGAPYTLLLKTLAMTPYAYPLRFVLVFLGASIWLGGCDSDPVDDFVGDILDGFFEAEDGMVIELGPTHADILQMGTTPLPGNVEVGDRYFYSMVADGRNRWRGSVLSASGRYETGRAVTMRGDVLEVETDIPAHTTWTRIEEPPPPPPEGFEGEWNRYGHPQGYDTDLKVGGIPGEPANRVYMCTLPPTPAPGLYKGTLQADGATIRWDAGHNVPDYVMQSTGTNTMVFFVPVVNAEGGRYRRGNWRPGSCGLNL